MESPPSFGEARDALRAAIARDANDRAVEAAALPRLYEHGGPVEHAVIVFHGFTNCPQQCDEQARGFYARGCNVYVPRIPRHGMKDRLTRDLANLTLAELQGSAEEAFRLARGLGRRVSAVGISLGATLTLWLAQVRPLDLAVPLAPFLMPIGIPRRPGMIAMHLLSRLPDMYWWWDPRVKENCRPVYAYPGYPTHGLAQCVFLGDAVFEEASKKPPLARRCTLVTNARESAVNDNVPRQLLDLWRRQRADCGEVVLRGLGEPRHDVIDPTTFPQGRTLVYPRLEALVLGDA